MQGWLEELLQLRDAEIRREVPAYTDNHTFLYAKHLWILMTCMRVHWVISIQLYTSRQDLFRPWN
jgi:hypothetical protein